MNNFWQNQVRDKQSNWSKFLWIGLNTVKYGTIWLNLLNFLQLTPREQRIIYLAERQIARQKLDYKKTCIFRAKFLLKSWTLYITAGSHGSDI